MEKYLPVLTSTSRLVYLNRSEAETDRRHKQLIPYVLLICSVVATAALTWLFKQPVRSLAVADGADASGRGDGGVN